MRPREKPDKLSVKLTQRQERELTSSYSARSPQLLREARIRPEGEVHLCAQRSRCSQQEGHPCPRLLLPARRHQIETATFLQVYGKRLPCQVSNPSSRSSHVCGSFVLEPCCWHFCQDREYEDLGVSSCRYRWSQRQGETTLCWTRAKGVKEGDGCPSLG